MLKGFPGLPQIKRTKSGRKMDIPNMMRTPENRSFSVLYILLMTYFSKTIPIPNMTTGTMAIAMMKPTFGPKMGVKMRFETVYPTYAPSI